MTHDLWPDFSPPTDLKAPVHLLKEQAAVLASKTNRIVQGHVQSYPGGVDKFLYALELISPAVPGYSYQLLNISYALEFYPLTLVAFGSESTASDEENFRKKLAAVFQDSRTKRVVEAIMAQAMALTGK